MEKTYSHHDVCKMLILHSSSLNYRVKQLGIKPVSREISLRIYSEAQVELLRNFKNRSLNENTLKEQKRQCPFKIVGYFENTSTTSIQEIATNVKSSFYQTFIVLNEYRNNGTVTVESKMNKL